MLTLFDSVFSDGPEGNGDNFMKISNHLSALAVPMVVAGLAFATPSSSVAGDQRALNCTAAAGGVLVSSQGAVRLRVSADDRVTVTANGNNSGSVDVVDVGAGRLITSVSAGQTFNLDIEAGGPELLQIAAKGQADTGTVTCVAGGALQVGAEAPGGDEALAAPSTEDVQNAFSAPMMMSHLGALYDDVHRNTAGVLNGTGNQSVSENGLFLQSIGKAAKDIPGARPSLNVFVSADVTSFDGDSFDGLTGNLTLGMDYRVSRDVVVGGLLSAGRADFSTLVNTNVGSLENTGFTVGVYAAAKVFGDVTVDGLVSYSGLDYDVANGGTTGDFDANRFGISLGIYNQLPFMGAILEPHARIAYGMEEQDSYTDSVGRTVGSNTVNTGRITLGPRLIAPTINGFTPWISANGVYEFSDSGNLATGAPDFDDTFSGRVGLGFDWDSDLGQIGAEVEAGGLGSGLYHSVSGSIQYKLSF